MAFLGFSGWKKISVCALYREKKIRKSKIYFYCFTGKSQNKQTKHTWSGGVRMVTCEFKSEKGHINNLNLSKKLNIFHMNK